MKKILGVIIGVMVIIVSSCSKGATGDEKTAEDYVRAEGYKITNRKGKVWSYVLEKGKLYGATENTPCRQMWAVQKVEPDEYFGKEITIYCFTVKQHPLEKTFKVMTNVYIMISDGKVIGGYSFPNEELEGSLYSLDGKTLEKVTGLTYKQWGENWKNKYGN